MTSLLSFKKAEEIFTKNSTVEVSPTKALAYDSLILDKDAKFYANGEAIPQNEVDIYIYFEGMKEMKRLHTITVTEFFELYNVKLN